MLRSCLTRAALVAAFLLFQGSAFAQNAVLQGGPFTSGHVPTYAGPAGFQAVVTDGGPAAGGGPGVGISELGITVRGTGTAPYANAGTGPLGTNLCDYDGPTTGPYHYLCGSANAQGGGLIVYGAGGGAPILPLIFNVNGTSYAFPFNVGGIIGPATSVVNDLACWNNTTGSLLKDCGTGVSAGANNAWTGSNSWSGSSTFTGTASFGALTNFTSTFQIASVTQTFPASGQITGNTDPQTLANKSIAASEINSGILSAALMPAFSGDITTVAGSTTTTLGNVNANVGTFVNPTVTANAKGLITAISSGSVNASGFVNKLRNSSQAAWFHGTHISVTTAGGWGSEGIYVVPTGATVTIDQVVNSLATSPLTVFATSITGAPSVTDVTVRFVVESYDAAPLANVAVTCQFPVKNSTGGAITPTLTVKHAGSLDNYSSPVTDVNAVSLQAISNGASQIEAYTFTSASGSVNGLSIDVDFGNNFSTSGKNIIIGGGFDCRATPGVTVGLNASPPAPEIRNANSDIAWSQRFFYSTYQNGTAPGASTTSNMGGMASGPASWASTIAAASGYTFVTPMRGIPSISFWDAAGNASKNSTLNASGAVLTNNLATSLAPAQISANGFVWQPLNNGNNDMGYIHVTADASLTGA